MTTGGSAIAVFAVGAASRFSELLHADGTNGVVIGVASGHGTIIICDETRHLTSMGYYNVAHITPGAVMISPVNP